MSRETELTVSEVKDMIKQKIETIQNLTSKHPNLSKNHPVFAKKEMLESLLSDIIKEEWQYELYCRAHNIT